MGEKGTTSRALLSSTHQGDASPWNPIIKSYGGGVVPPPSSYPPSCAVVGPPTHFFVKKKFIPIGGTETATAESPERVLLRSHSLRRGDAVRRTESPAGGSCASSVGRREYPARRRELFSLRKKRTGRIRLSARQEDGSLYRLDPTPFSPLKITGSKGI